METRFYCCLLRHFSYSLLRIHTSHHNPAVRCLIRNSEIITRKRSLIHRNRVRYASTQASPVGGFYESLLENPLPPASDPAAAKLRIKSPPPDQPRETSSKTQREEVAAKARVVFGSRLAGPAERRQVKDRASQIVAGIRVPPKPVEPDNCCMSGCVNCVWDVYRDDVEEWAFMKKKASKALLAQLRRKGGTGLMLGEGEKNATHTMISMDDDGGGSEANWGNIEGEIDENEALFSGVPIGIREFMKQEKRLKEKHLREGTKGG